MHLAKQTLGDRGLEQEVLRIYEQACRTYLGGVKAAQSEQELKVNLHSLKGASAGVGAHAVANAARAGEAELRETGAVSDETVQDIGFAVEEVSTYIADLLKA